MNPQIDLEQIVNRLNNIERFLFDALIVISHMKDQLGVLRDEE